MAIAEQAILKLNSKYKYNGISLLKDGNTELFYRDIREDEDE